MVQRFGSQARLAKLLGKSASTVRYWQRVGTIPSFMHAAVLKAAQVNGIPLSPGELVQGTSAPPVSSERPGKPKAVAMGELVLGEGGLPVYVLDDGRRVVSRTGATELLTLGRGGGNLESYLNVASIRPYMPHDLDDQLIEFGIPEVVNKTVRGMTAETFLELCTAYVRARDGGADLTDRQREIATEAGVILAACAKIGLIALIDEATGYQYMREEDALRVKLRVFLDEEMRKWEKTFPDELWQEFGRLTNWKGSITNRPKYWGKLVMDLIYRYLDPDVADWLKEHAPTPRHGQNYHQWLSSQYGLKRLTEHIWMVIGLAKACRNMSELKYRMAEQFGKDTLQITFYLDPPSRDQERAG